MRALLLFLMLVALAGCASIETPLDEDYQFGGTTQSLLELQERWCDQGNLVARGLLLMSVRAAVPDYPEAGLCTGLSEVISNASSNGDRGAPRPPRPQGAW